jgi:hypothetical protein
MTGVAPVLTEIDPAWLADVLRAGGHTEANVVAVEAEALTITGATTDMARLRVTYDDMPGPGPASMIAKIRGRDELRVQMDAALGLFAREARFYTEFARRVPVRKPLALHVGDGRETPLLLEDLGELRMGDQAQGLSIRDAEACLDALADMHAAFWESPELKDDWLTRPSEGSFKAMIAQLMVSGVSALSGYEGKVPAGVIAQVPQDPERWQRIIGRLGEGPHTLVHNDCRLDNFFFADDGAPIFVDWQLPADTRGSQDVANLLAGSMEPHDLSTHWETLLRRYHDRLETGGVSGYSFDECVLHYRQNVIWALGQGLSLLGSLGEGDHRGVGDKIVVRSLSHISELASFEAVAER